jgi:DNA primase large subunit
MQLASTKLTKTDLALYPFLKETQEYVRKLDFKIDDLKDPTYANVLRRAEERVQQAILYSLVSMSKNLRNLEIEILSFPVAILLTTATENSFIKKRYALAEANQAFIDMEEEPRTKILALAQNFGWKIELNEKKDIPYEFALRFTDYVRNTTHLRDKEWKLINRPVSYGKVYLNGTKIARLLMEEVRRYIERRLDTKELPKFPPDIMVIAERIKKLTIEEIGKPEQEGLPKAITQEAFPPCIKALYEAFSSGHHLSHVGRFTLTSFLINIGMPVENVVELFKSVSDFNERMTRYQVEHIAGERGSRTPYIPPKCDTLQTHGVCTNSDELCRRLRHPLAYYRRKARATK